MAFDLTGLTPFRDEELMALIRASILEGRTASIITVQPGIKSTASINILSGPIDPQDGTSCGFNAQGDTVLSQRDIAVNPVKVQESYCPNDLEQYYTQKMMNAGSYNEDIPFEVLFAEEKVARMQSLIENLIWQGDVAGAAPLNLADGLLKVIDAEASVVDAGGLSFTPAAIIDSMDDMVELIPEDVVDADDLKLFVGYEVFRTYAKALRDANLYHYPSTNDGTQDFRMFIPGTNVEMIAVKGLNGTGRAILAEASNLYYGTDLMSDYEDFKLWYSEDNQEVRFHSRFKVGTNVAFPERIVKAG